MVQRLESFQETDAFKEKSKWGQVGTLGSFDTGGQGMHNCQERPAKTFLSMIIFLTAQRLRILGNSA